MYDLSAVSKGPLLEHTASTCPCQPASSLSLGAHAADCHGPRSSLHRRQCCPCNIDIFHQFEPGVSRSNLAPYPWTNSN